VVEIMLGQRVELHPNTDEWMMGDKYGQIIDISSETGNIRVLMDKSLRELIVHPRNVYRWIS
jgi:hypothetical protein